MSTLVSNAKLAVHLGCLPPVITKYEALGVVEKTASGKFDQDLSSSGSRSRRQRGPSANLAGGCALRSSPQRRSKKSLIPPHRQKSERSVGGN